MYIHKYIMTFPLGKFVNTKMNKIGNNTIIKSMLTSRILLSVLIVFIIFLVITIAYWSSVKENWIKYSIILLSIFITVLFIAFLSSWIDKKFNSNINNPSTGAYDELNKLNQYNNIDNVVKPNFNRQPGYMAGSAVSSYNLQPLPQVEGFNTGGTNIQNPQVIQIPGAWGGAINPPYQSIQQNQPIQPIQQIQQVQSNNIHPLMQMNTTPNQQQPYMNQVNNDNPILAH